MIDNDKKISVIKKLNYNDSETEQKNYINYSPITLFMKDTYLVFADIIQGSSVIKFVDLSSFKIVYSITIDIPYDFSFGSNINQLLNINNNLLIINVGETYIDSGHPSIHYKMKIFKFNFDEKYNYSYEQLFDSDDYNNFIVKIQNMNDNLIAEIKDQEIKFYSINNNIAFINSINISQYEDSNISYMQQLKCNDNIFLICMDKYYLFFEKLDKKFNLKLIKSLVIQKFNENYFGNEQNSIYEKYNNLYIGGKTTITIINLLTYEIQSIIELNEIMKGFYRAAEMINDSDSLLYSDEFGYLYKFNIKNYDISEICLISEKIADNFISVKSKNFYISNLGKEIIFFKININTKKIIDQITSIKNQKKLVNINLLNTFNLEKDAHIEALTIINNYIAIAFHLYNFSSIALYDMINYSKITFLEEAYNSYKSVKYIGTVYNNMLIAECGKETSGNYDIYFHTYIYFYVYIWKIMDNGKNQFIKKIEPQSKLFTLISNEKSLILIDSRRVTIYNMNNFQKEREINNKNFDTGFALQIKNQNNYTDKIINGSRSKIIIYDIEKEVTLKLIKYLGCKSLYQINDNLAISVGNEYEFLLIDLNKNKLLNKIRNTLIKCFYVFLPIIDNGVYAHVKYNKNNKDEDSLIEIDYNNHNINFIKDLEDVKKIENVKNEDENNSDSIFLKKDDNTMIARFGRKNQIKILELKINDS